MKKIIALSVILFFTVASNAQESKVIDQVGISTSFYFIDGTFRVLAIPKIQFGGEKHHIDVGPTVLYASDVVTSDDNFPKLTGVQLEYQYSPTIATYKINFSLFTQLTFQSIKDNWSSVQWESSIEQYVEYKYLNKENLTTAFVGYGIQLGLGKRFLVVQSAGIGGYYSSLDGDEISVDAPEVNEQLAASYKTYGLSYVVNIGIRYKL